MKKNEINVLIVDDDRAISKTLSEAIVRAGYRAAVSGRADDALIQVKMMHFDAAVIDCMLPIKNGVMLAEELRNTRFNKGAIVLMSGVFRDKSFEADALRKTNAIAYLQKPFGPADLMAALKPYLESLTAKEVWSLRSILTRKIQTTRDRMKLVEHLTEIRGVECVFVLSILMDAKVSGFLNVVSTNGDIFGVSLQAGLIDGVDSETANDIAIQYLIDTGYLTKEDWKEFETTEVRKGSPLQRLVAAGLISPHAAMEAKKDHIVYDLRRIIGFETINVNFVPAESENSVAEGLALVDALKDLDSVIAQNLSASYLKEFFHENLAAAFQKLDAYDFKNPVWNLPSVQRIKPLIEKLSDDGSLDDLLSKNVELTLEILTTAYYLVMFRQILFTDLKALKTFEVEVERRKKVLEEMQGKSAFEIFLYFGSSDKFRSNEVEKVFTEFTKANHPDLVPPEAPKALRDVTTAVFAMVSSAHDALVDPDKRERMEKELRFRQAEKDIRADVLANEGNELLRRGNYAKAEEKIQESYDLSQTNRIYCLMIWARVKQRSKQMEKSELNEIKKRLESFPLQDRQDPPFHMAVGLVRAALGDVSAIISFEKALSVSPNFVEARREINALQGKKKDEKGESVNDILTGDISQIVSQIFKRKAK